MRPSSGNPESACNSCHRDPTGSAQQEEHFIGEYEKAPAFMKDNLNITHGYRINFNTPSRILRSLFMLHNQSVNIWTHCLPALFLVFLMLSFLLMVDGQNSLSQHRQDIERNLLAFHQRLSNISFAEEAGQQMEAMRVSVLTNYQELLQGIEAKSLEMRSLLETNLQDFRTSISDDLLYRLQAFEKSKRRFEQEIAPRVVRQFSSSINGSFLQVIGEHLQELKQHLDSPAFEAMELHGEIPNPQHVSKWPVFVFLLSAVICLLNSTIFHLFHPLSSKAYGVLLRFDFAGISLLIAGSAFPCIYYGMYCQMAVALLYLSWAFLAAVACFVICLFEWIHRPGNEKYRSVVFGSFGFSMAVPLSHLVINEVWFDNYGDPYKFSSSGVYYALLISCYIIGLYIFTVRCPQRNNPGRYNLCGHSHQIWHVMVVLGIFFSYFGIMENFQMRKASVCPA